MKIGIIERADFGITIKSPGISFRHLDGIALTMFFWEEMKKRERLKDASLVLVSVMQDLPWFGSREHKHFRRNAFRWNGKCLFDDKRITTEGEVSSAIRLYEASLVEGGIDLDDRVHRAILMKRRDLLVVEEIKALVFDWRMSRFASVYSQFAPPKDAFEPPLPRPPVMSWEEKKAAQVVLTPKHMKQLPRHMRKRFEHLVVT